MLEVVIAIGIVVVAFVGVVGSVSHVLQLNYSARSNFLASYLAEECMEAVRYKHDLNIKNNLPFYTGIGSLSTTTNFAIDWTLATTSEAVGAVVSSTANVLKVSTSTGYVLASNASCVVPTNGCTTSTFDRMAKTVWMTDNGVNLLDVTCQVFWQDRDLTNLYQTHTRLYDYAQ